MHVTKGEPQLNFFNFLLQCTTIYGYALQQEVIYIYFIKFLSLLSLKKYSLFFFLSLSLSLRHPSSPLCGQLVDSGAHKIHIKTHRIKHPTTRKILDQTTAIEVTLIHQTHIIKHHKTQNTNPQRQSREKDRSNAGPNSIQPP